jgi:hypothetical protein
MLGQNDSYEDTRDCVATLGSLAEAGLYYSLYQQTLSIAEHPPEDVGGIRCFREKCLICLDEVEPLLIYPKYGDMGEHRAKLKSLIEIVERAFRFVRFEQVPLWTAFAKPEVWGTGFSLATGKSAQ